LQLLQQAEEIFILPGSPRIFILHFYSTLKLITNVNILWDEWDIHLLLTMSNEVLWATVIF